jgi:hypothetical protein
MILKIFSPGAFLLALICFTLPFTKVSCSGKDGKEIVIREAKGWEMAFGHTVEQDSLQQQQRQLESLAEVPNDMSMAGDKSVTVQPLVLVAFIAVVLALILALTLRGKLLILPGALGILAFAVMIGYVFHFSRQLKTEPMAGTMFSDIKLKVQFLAAFWASCLFMLAGGLLCFVQARQSLKADTVIENTDMLL